ncbi:MAG: acyl-CoA thioesterase [Inhella sp.]
MSPPFTRQRLIRFSDCDPAGIVFYPQLFVMFNGLVEDWFNEGLGIGYAELIGPRRIGLPIVALQTEFRAVSRHGDKVELGLALARIGSRWIDLALQLSAGAELRVVTRQTLVTTSLDSHRAITIPEDLRSALLRFQESGEPAHA